MDIHNLEERKLKEIEHSSKRRKVLQGFERNTDTNADLQVEGLDGLIKDKADFEYHFSNMKFYSIVKASEKFKTDWLDKRCDNSQIKVLDWACGNGENGIYAASKGANCIGIDISPEGIQNANNNAKNAGVDKHCTFETMDGENMSFEDNTFDVGVEYGALHHVELDAALAELSRVLKPTGEMICIEAMRHNPFIHWYRRRTPHLRTEWEVDHILGVESLDVMRRYFDKVEVRFFHLTALALVPFRKKAIFNILLPFFNAIDRVLLKPKFIGKFGWIMVIELGRPKK